jgi:hypothetical protein
MEQAVRARVKEFYTLLLNRDYRKAEAYMAEDTRDWYYNGSKLELSNFEVKDIEFFENFTHARAWTLVSQQMVVANFPPSTVNLRMPTAWRLENGNWYVYLEPRRVGLMGGTVAAGVNPTATPKGNPMAGVAMPSALGKVHFDKRSVELAAGGSERVTITNESQAVVSLVLGAPVNGLAMKLDHDVLNGGEKAILTLTNDNGLDSGICVLQVMPSQEILSVQVHGK